MSQKLLYLISFVLVLAVGLTSVADAATLPGLIGWYKLDEMTGTIVYDSSGLGNHGTFGPEGDPQWVAGHFGGALDLDGDDDYVILDALVDDIAAVRDLSMTAWIKTTQTNDGTVIGGNHGNSHDVIWGVINGNHLSESDTLYEYPPKINDNQWHHIAYVRDGTTAAYLYTDGVLVGTETPTGEPWLETAWSIGQEYDPAPSDEYNGLVDDVHFFNRPLTAAEVIQVMMGVPPGAASEPSPEDETIDVPREVVLSWQPGEFTPPVNGHKIYLSESFNDVNDGIGAITQSASSYAPPQRLELNTTYYWRVEEVNGSPDFTVHESSVWSFTTEPLAYPIENITATASSTGQPGMEPENTINGSGLDANDLHSTEAMDMWLSDSEPNGAWIEYEFDKVHKLHEMWVWNANQTIESLVGFGLKDVTIEYSTNGTDYTTLGTTNEFVRAPGTFGYAHNTTVDFGGTTAKYVRLTANSNWGGVLDKYGLSEVRFLYIPVHAKEPSPDSGATEVAVDVTLGFRAGREAVTHDVYLSTDEQVVIEIDGNAPVTTVTEASYGPLSLDLGTTYYWKINEVNETETTTTWQSDLWSFTTTDHLVVDDFEDYNDYPPDEIWSTWIDGYGVATNGATVGYPDPAWSLGEHYVETTIVHGGDQSLPFFYSNAGGAAYSEGERTFAVPQDWTAASVQTLALHFHGTAGNTGQLYVKVNGTKVPYDGQASNLALTGWQAWNIDLASSGASLQNVTTLAIGIDGNGASGTLYFDDFRLYPFERQFITPAEPDSAGLIGHWKFDGDTLDSSGLGNHGTAGGDPTFVVGKVGSGAIDLDGIGDYVEIDGVADDITANIFTLTAWIKTTQTAEGTLFGANDNSGGHDLQFGVKGGNVWVDDGPETQFPPVVNDDQWHFIVYARDGDTAYIYVDGALRSTDEATDNPAGETRWSIGQEWDPPTSSDEYEGMVDDVRFYNYALSLGEVAWLAGWTEPFDKPF